ncbi:MAG: M48 family metallopeptidase [Pseudomonadota bacterium]
MNTQPTTARLTVDYFDGRRAQAKPVQLWFEHGMLQIEGRGMLRQVPIQQVQWPERTRHGARIAHLQDGSSLHTQDGATWDRWVHAHGVSESLVVKAQQSWRWTAAATALLLTVCIASYLWGLPMAGRALSPLVPTSVDQQLGELALQSIESRLLSPSQTPLPEQQRLSELFAQAVKRAFPTEPPTPLNPPYRLHFRKSHIGPNAFALPDGSIIVTDELITLLKGRDDVLLGVLGHELGHVQRRHAIRMLIQTGLLGAATSVALGDFSTLLAGAPALMGHLAYSRHVERESDESAIAFLQANDIRPSVMVDLFERLHPSRNQPRGHDTPVEGEGLGIAFSSHPADAERIARFKAAGPR